MEVIVLLMVTRVPAKALDAAGEVARSNLAVRPEKCLQGGGLHRILKNCLQELTMKLEPEYSPISSYFREEKCV